MKLGIKNIGYIDGYIKLAKPYIKSVYIQHYQYKPWQVHRNATQNNIYFSFSDLNDGDINKASTDDKANFSTSKSETTNSVSLVNGVGEDSDNVTVTASLKQYHEKNKEANDIPNTTSLIQKKLIEYVEESDEDFVDEDEDEEDENKSNDNDGSPKMTDFEFDVSIHKKKFEIALILM